MIKKIKFIGLIAIFYLLVNPVYVKGQVSLISLEDCQEMARQNYPLINTLELLESTAKYSVDNIKTGYLPSFSLYGQYTNQSDVTKLPISLPNIQLPEIERNQYKVYAEINQVVYDGGVISSQKRVAEAQSAIDKDNLEVELYKVKEKVTQVYFGVLLLDAQISQSAILLSDLNTALKKSEVAFNNGILLKSNLDALKAEILKTDQKIIELKSARKSYLDVLSLLTGKTFTENLTLKVPVDVQPGNEINRPENRLFSSRINLNNQLSKTITAKNLPRLNLFLVGGYGSPGLNMLDPDPSVYYTAGLRFIWPLTGFYNLHREKAMNSIATKNITFQNEAFLFNTRIQLSQQNREIDKFESLLMTDDEIISLRDEISKSALVQLENGIITSADYIRELNLADNARQSKILHEVQLMMSKYNYQLIRGN